MFLYSNLRVKIKLMNKKCLPIMPCIFSNDLFALKKCYILHIENLTSNKYLGIKLLMNKFSYKLIVAFTLET